MIINGRELYEQINFYLMGALGMSKFHASAGFFVLRLGTPLPKTNSFSSLLFIASHSKLLYQARAGPHFIRCCFGKKIGAYFTFNTSSSYFSIASTRPGSK